MIRFTPDMDILPDAQKRLWPELACAPKLGFVLYGGTAIALRLGHRQSVDFDFFTDKPLDKAAIEAAFPFLLTATVLQDSTNTFEVLVPYGASRTTHVKVSFFGLIDVGRVGEPEQTDDGVLQVASLDDLMAMKAKVLLQRVEVKDYRDMAAMIRAGVSLPKGLASASAMWPGRFQPSECLKALVYFEGGDLHNLTPEERETLIDAASSVDDLPAVDLVAHALCDPAAETDIQDGASRPSGPRMRM